MRDAAPERVITSVRPVITGLAPLLYRGSSVQCPVCDGQFRCFARFHDRADARCPRCRSLERHRSLILYLRRATDLMDRPQRVLHIAPEFFLQQQLKQVHGAGYVSGDVASPDAMLHLDVTDLQFEDASFDVVLCSHVFEHVLDDRRAMLELQRVLRPGGWGILDAPTDESRASTYEDWSLTSPRERQRAFGQWDHVRVYGRDYPDLLQAAGFRIEIDPLTYTPEEIRRYGLRLGLDRLYLCRRDPD